MAWSSFCCCEPEFLMRRIRKCGTTRAFLLETYQEEMPEDDEESKRELEKRISAMFSEEAKSTHLELRRLLFCSPCAS